MSDKDYSQLTSATTAADTDLLAIYPVGGPLKKLTWATFKSLTITALGGSYLTVSNNLSDLGSASSARANLGLGTAATLASGALFQVSNNLSEVSNAATARTNIGAAASSAPTITGGMTFSGTTKQSVLAMGALDIDWSAQEIQTKSISADSTFTFSNFTASKAQAMLLKLTITSAATPSWPASVKYQNGVNFSSGLGNGTHWIGLLTDDGGTTVTAVLIAKAIA